MNINVVGNEKKLQLQELEDIRNDAYENAHIYKEKIKALYCIGPFIVTKVYPHSAVEI